MTEPILIALLALVGSALGGFASPVLLRMLDRRYAREDRLADESKEKQLQIRAALQEFSDKLVAWALAWQNDADTDDYWLYLVAAHQRVQLLIEKDDADVADALSDQLARVVEGDLTTRQRGALIGQINAALTVWYRGDSAANAKKLLERADTP